MQFSLKQEFALQKKIPIIGKGSIQEIEEKFQKLVSEKYNIIEITLRSNVALQTAIKLKEKNPKIKIGLGSIKSLSVLKKVSILNFDFYISPGINPTMAEYANNNNISFIPGVATPSEILTAIEFDLKLLKYFHSERNGGIKSLKFLHEIFDEINFIPTGGINNENFASYLNLKNVVAVGSTSF